MAKQIIDLVDQLKLAWQERVDFSHERREENAVALLKRVHDEYATTIRSHLASIGQPYANQAFTALQNVLVYLCCCDGQYSQGECDAYTKLCYRIGMRPLSVEEVRSKANNMSISVLTKNIAVFTFFRDRLSAPIIFEYLISGLCTFAFLGTGKLNENEFYVLKTFLNTGFDWFPQTWEQLDQQF